MNYDKLSRSLRYYYEKGIMQKASDRPAGGGGGWKLGLSPTVTPASQGTAGAGLGPVSLVPGWLFPGGMAQGTSHASSSQVAGERYVYKFVCDPDALFSMAYPDNQRPFLKTEPDCPVPEEETVPLTHFEDSPAFLLEMEPCGSLPYAEAFAY